MVCATAQTAVALFQKYTSSIDLPVLSEKKKKKSSKFLSGCLSDCYSIPIEKKNVLHIIDDTL